jgi:hypothetical protein
MIGWLIAWGVSYLFGAGWAFIGSLALAIFFPRLTQFLFATVVFPVYTLFFGTWAFIMGWRFGWHEFAWEVWKSCAFWTAIPVGFVTWYLARGVREVGVD